jgi:hypothetical protein
MIVRATALAVVLSLVLAPAALAQVSDPFAPESPVPGQQQQQQTQAPVPQTRTSTGNGGLAGWQEALIFIAAAVLMGGIAYGIIRDARQRAPVREPAAEAAAAAGGRRPAADAKARARAKQKSARQQRKRNRS